MKYKKTELRQWSHTAAADTETDGNAVERRHKQNSTELNTFYINTWPTLLFPPKRGKRRYEELGIIGSHIVVAS